MGRNVFAKCGESIGHRRTYMQTNKLVGVLFAILLIVLVGQVAMADTIPVKYSTSGIFNPPGDTSVLTNGAGSISYNSVSDLILYPEEGVPIDALFGSFTTTTADFHNAVNNVPFDLTITQDIPSPGGSETFSASFSGKLGTTGVGKLPEITFTGLLSQTVFGDSYDVTYTMPSGTLLMDNAGGSVDVVGTLEVVIKRNLGPEGPESPGTVVPEPTSLFLLGTGIGALGLAAWRKRK
jgi:hypothetical protein